MSGAELGRVELGGIDLGASLTPLDARRMGLRTGNTLTGTGDVVLAAGHNLTLGAADNVHSEDHGMQVTTTGAQRSGLHGMFGVSKAGQAGTETDTTPSGSLVGSTDGSVTLSAGQDVRISASDVLSQSGTAIVGQNVTIEAGVGTADSHQSQELHTGGIVGGLTGGAASAAEQVWASGQRAGQVKDKRLAALYAAQAGYAVSDAYQGISNGVAGAQGQAVQGNQNEDGSASASGAQGAANASGISLRIGIGASSAAAHSDSHDDIAYASHIQSAGDVTIAATGGDLNLIGSQVSGDNVTLAAAHDLNLLSQTEQHTQKESSANASGEVGLSIGSTTGIYVSVAGGKGRAHGNGQTHATSDVQARDTLHLASGNDTTVQGAQARGNTVLADIGGNLGIASEQDTDDYASTNVQAGITLVYGFSGSGVGVSGNLAYGQMDSDYASVTQVSGLAAGSGGYHLDVGGNTSLTGGVIASTADPQNNHLSTGTLTYSDIANKAHYDAFSVSIGGGYGTGAMSGGSFTMGGSIPQDHSSHSTTQAGIAQGTIEVRNGPADLSGLDRNPDIDAKGLKSIFDQEKVQERQEMGQVAGQIAFTAVKGVVASRRDKAQQSLTAANENYQAAVTDADRAIYKQQVEQAQADLKAWGDGGVNKVALQALAGAFQASMGGGDALSSAVGVVADEAFLTRLGSMLNNHGVDADSGAHEAAMGLASTGLGWLAGSVTGSSGSGAAGALTAQQYGYFDYRDGRRQAMGWQAQALKNAAGGDENVRAAMTYLIDKAMKAGANPADMATALANPEVAESLVGMALAESTSRSLYGGMSFDDLSDAQKLAVMERLGGSVTVGSTTVGTVTVGTATNADTGTPWPGDAAVGSTVSVAQTGQGAEGMRSQIGAAATLLIVNGERGVEKAVNWMGKDTATALAYVAMAAMGGPVKTAGSYFWEQSSLAQWLQQEKESQLIQPFAGMIGTYGFGAQTDEQQQGVYPASHAVASTGVNAVLSSMGILGTRQAAKGIVKDAEGFSKKVDAADRLVEGEAKGAGQALREVEVNSGSKGAWSKELNNPEPNTLYKVDGNKTYQTDSLGRVNRVESNLSLSKKDRNTYQQCAAGKCGAPGDEGGHLIASILNDNGVRFTYLGECVIKNGAQR